MFPQGTTKLYALIGSPVDHSKSPHMHNLSFEETGVDGCYLAFDCNEDNLEETVEALKRLDAQGWNVTMPCKSKMAELCDELSPEAELIGAVNTVVNRDGKLTGYSTDGIGFFDNLRDKGYELADKKLVMIGAGGAARSIAAQAVQEDIDELLIFNRTLSKAQDLVTDIQKTAEKNGIHVEAFALEDQDGLSEKIKKADILIDATSVGMNPNSNETLLKADDLREGLLVADVVYTPKQTELLKEAQKRGAEVVDGLGMVLWQGAYAFEKWTGKEFPIEKVKTEVFS